MGKLMTEDDFNNLIISSNDGYVIRLRDVATARLGPENEETILNMSGLILGSDISGVRIYKSGSDKIIYRISQDPDFACVKFGVIRYLQKSISESIRFIL